jgi:predicted transcriptional regulator
MPNNGDAPPKNASVDRRRMVDLLFALSSPQRWQIIDILREVDGKNIKSLGQKLGLSHTAASNHVRILRSAGVVEAVLVDQDDPRLTHQRLAEKNLVTDDEGKQWLDFGNVKICLD